MNWQANVFLGLLANQIAATVAFVALYVRESDWRRSAVGRHVLYWSVASGVLDVVWVLLLTVKQPWLIYLLLGAQAGIGLLTWRRVWLVRQAQHVGDDR